MKFKKTLSIILFLFLILSLTSCAPAGPTEFEYGFFGGFWHGFIFTFSVIGKVIGWLFGFSIGLFAETNSGIPYFLGVLIGFIVIRFISRGIL